MDVVIEARLDIGRSYFREIIIAICWIIWTSGNRLIFYNIPCTVNKWKEHFKNEISLVCIKAKPNLEGALNLWLANLP